MKNKFLSKAVPRGTRTIWRYLGALIILFTFAIGNVLANTQTYSFASSSELANFTYTAGDASDTWNVCTSKTNNVEPRDGGFVQYKCAKSSKIATFVTASSFDNISNISFYIASSDKGKTQVKIEVSSKADFSSDVTEIVNATGGLSGLGISSPANNTWYSVSKSVASKSGYVRFTMTASSSGKYWSFDDIVITYTPSSGGDPVCPSGLTISSKDSKTAFTEGDAIELTAALSAGNGDISYQWYKGSVAPANAISGATNAKYEVASCTTANAGDYFCVASKDDCSDAVNASAFSITVEADPKCFNMPEITSKPADLASVVVTGGTLSDVSTAKAVVMNANGLKLDGNSVYLKVTLADASIIAGTKITVAWKGAGSGAGIAVVNGDLAEKVIDETNVEAAGSATHTFTAAEAANYADEFIIHRNASGTGIYVNAIIVEDCGPAVTKHTITLNYNDGETPAGSLKVVDGNAAVKPADPTRGKYTFLGWFVGDTDNEYVWSTAVKDDITLKAHWQDPWTLTFDADGGSAVADVTVKHNTKAEKPADPTKDDYDFMGWYYGTPAVAFDWDANVTQDYALVAHWESAVAKYDVEYYDGDTKIGTEPQVWANQHPTAAGIETAKPLYTFVGWYLTSALEGDPVALNTVTPVEGLKLYGKWTKAYATSYDMEAYAVSDGATLETLLSNLDAAGYAYTNVNGIDYGHTHNYIYDGMKYKTNDGDLSFNVNAGKLVIVKTGNLPANALTMYINGVADPTVFVGANEAVETHVNNYFYSEAEALYRLDIQASKGTCAIKAVTITDPFEVSYDADGGSEVAAQYGEPSVTLPLPVKGTESFLGWFDGETKVGMNGDIYTPTANITLVAHWEAVSTDARLASISFSSDAGTLSPTFDPEVVNYTYTMPYGTAAIPTITGATSVSAKAKTPVVDAQAANWNDVAHIHGVAESDDTKDYYITMKIAPKDGVCLIKGNVGNNTFVIDEEASLLSGTPSKNNVKSESSTYETLTGWKFNSRPAHLGLTLSEGTFQEGDVVEVFVTTVTDDYMRVFDANDVADEHKLAEGTAKMVQGKNQLVLPTGTNAASLYLVRGPQDAAYDMWNPYVAYFAVYRPMMPTLTAITIDGRDGEIDALDDKHFSVTIPYESDLAALTVVPTIIRNAAHATTPEAVISNAGAWIEGDNTYRIMDKDGDYTDYTITLDRDVLKHTVSFNTHGGSAVPSVEVVDGQKLAAAPADPTKDDYLFQGWAETEDGTIVDVTSFTITADKEFHAVWAADGAIKLLDGTTINHTNFITGVTETSTVNFDDADHDCLVFSGTVSDVNGVKDLTRVVAYNATTNQTKIQITAYNNASSAREIRVKGLVEGSSDIVNLGTIALDPKTKVQSAYLEFNNADAKNRTVYAIVPSSAGDVKILQVKVIDDGTIATKVAGEVGYSLNLNQGRFFGTAGANLSFEGLSAKLSGDYTAKNSGAAKLKETSMSFTAAAPVLLKVTAANNKTYYVANSASGTTNETAKTGESEFNLAAGTWYINAGADEVQFAKIEFAMPKCEKPVIAAIADVDLCEGDAFTALVASASVGDGGTLHYAWFKEAGATDEAVGTDAASFTPEADGEYYVIVTNQLAGFADNTETSNAVTVQHLAGTVITTAPANVRKDAGEAATLTVVAAGKNLAYEWFTCNADGTGAVAVDPAATDASLDVIVPDGEQYYKVVVTGDCGTVEAIAKVEKWVELPQLDVTASMTWDWTYAGENNKLAAGKNVEVVMANIRENDKIPTNDETFRSQALLFYGENVRAVDGGRAYASIGHIAFHTTVPGVVIVEFSDNGANNRRVSINGKLSEASASKTDVKTFSANVPAGEIVITGVKSDGTGENQYIRISKIEFIKVDYTRDVTPGRLGTICLPNGGQMYGAGLYEVAYFDADAKKIFFDEIISGEMEAGRPYLFLPNDGVDLLAVAYNDDPEELTAGHHNGLYGSYTQQALPTDGNHYIMLNNQYCKVVAANTCVGANRAYIQLDKIGNDYVAPAYGRRRVSMGVQQTEIATGIENLNIGDQPMKIMIDGQIYILRGEKMYDATGRLVK